MHISINQLLIDGTIICRKNNINVLIYLTFHLLFYKAHFSSITSIYHHLQLYLLSSFLLITNRIIKYRHYNNGKPQSCQTLLLRNNIYLKIFTKLKRV